MMTRVDLGLIILKEDLIEEGLYWRRYRLKKERVGGLTCSWTAFRNSSSSSRVCRRFSASICSRVSLSKSWKRHRKKMRRNTQVHSFTNFLTTAFINYCGSSALSRISNHLDLQFCFVSRDAIGKIFASNQSSHQSKRLVLRQHIWIFSNLCQPNHLNEFNQFN